jgi:hypothetical protein
MSNRELGPRDPAAADMLTVVSLPIVEPVTPHAQVSVSNSALSPVTSLSVSRDGKWAFATEYRGPAPANATTIDELPKGSTLTAIDLRDPLRPSVAATKNIGAEPMSVSVHPDGELLAVATHASGQRPRRSPGARTASSSPSSFSSAARSRSTPSPLTTPASWASRTPAPSRRANRPTRAPSRRAGSSSSSTTPSGALMLTATTSAHRRAR